MKLHLTATSERGKPVTKSGNESLGLQVLDENRKVIFWTSIVAQGNYTALKVWVRGQGIAKNYEVSKEYYFKEAKPKTARECAHGARIDETCLTCSPELRELFK